MTLPFQFGPPGPQMSAPEFGAVNMGMAGIGQGPVTQAQMAANSASKDVYSNMALQFGSPGPQISQFGSPGPPDVTRLWISEPRDGYHRAGPCDSCSHGGRQL